MKLVKLSDIFKVSYGTKFDMNKMQESDSTGIAFVSRSSNNNGIVGYVEPYNDVKPLEAGCITVTLGGSYVLAAFLQERPFYTAQNVAVLMGKTKLSTSDKLFYCMCITKNRFRYSAFGREANRSLKDLLVPDISEIPSWVKSAKTNEFDDADEPLIDKKVSAPALDNVIRLDAIFNIRNGVVLNGIKEFDEPFPDSVMLVRPASTHQSTKRGYISKSDISKEDIYPKNTLFVSTNGEGSHTYSYVSTEEFVPNSDVSVLVPKKAMPLELKLFYSTCITKNRYLFSYGRKPKGEKLKRILLPELQEDQSKLVVQFVRSLKYSRIALTP